MLNNQPFKKTMWYGRLLIIFFLALLLPLLSTAADQTRPQQHAAIAQLSEQMMTLQQQLQQKQKTYVQLQHELAQIETHYGLSAQQLQKTNQQLTAEHVALNKLHQSLMVNQHSLQQEQQQLALQLRTAYMLGNQPYLKFILDEQQAVATSRIFHYFHYLTHYQTDDINTLQQQIITMQHTEQLLQQHYQKLQQLEWVQNKQQQQLNILKQNRSQLIQYINRSIQNKHQQLAQLIANRQRLLQTINQLPTKPPAFSPNSPQMTATSTTKQNAPVSADTSTLHQFISRLVGISNFASLQGKLSWPTTGKVSAHFNDLMDVGGLRWDGVLIDAKLNQPVYAVANGRVVFAKWLSGYGLLIIINHDHGYMTLYGRNHILYKHVNDEVHAGDMIATVGQSGGYQQAKLYFAIRHNAQPLNPNAWCR